MIEQTTLPERDANDKRIRHNAVELAKAKALIASHDPAELDAILAGNERVITDVIERPMREELVAYLEAVRAYLCRYVAFPSEHEAVAVALWVAHAHRVEQFETSPILAVTSAEMRSGKTRVFDCLEQLVPNPLRMVTPSEALLYTVLAQRPRRTVLLDEVDAIFTQRGGERFEGIRAVLNAGNRKGTPVLRVNMEGRQRKVDEFDVFGAKAVAGIGNLPTTVADRAIPIRMRRRAPGEMVERFRDRTSREQAAEIRAPDFSVPDVPVVPITLEGLNDRAADGWEPLLLIAEAAGGEWPSRARLAAVALSGGDQVEVSTGMRLLSDIRDAFDEQQNDHLTTGALLDWLHELEEAQWADWYGKPLTARALAKLLEPYRVVPLRSRVRGKGNLRGYFRSEFRDAWSRYVVGTDLTGTNGTSGTVEESEDDILEQLHVLDEGPA